jgi:hypothetical protein
MGTKVQLMGCVVLLVVQLSSTAQAQNEEAIVQVRTRDERASELFRAERYAEALLEMEAAQRLLPASTRLYNMAVCHERLHQLEQATALYREFVGAPDAPGDRRVRAVDRIAALQAELANPEAQQAELSTPEAQQPRAEAPVRPYRAHLLASSTTTGVIGLTALTLGVVAQVLSARFPSLRAQDELAKYLIEHGDGLALAADIFIGLAAASAVVTVVFAVLYGRRASSDAGAGRRSRLTAWGGQAPGLCWSF